MDNNTQSELVLKNDFKSFVTTAYRDNVEAGERWPLSWWLSARCSATDYEASNADVLCDVFINQDYEATDDYIELLESLTTAEIARALAGEWDSVELAVVPPHQNQNSIRKHGFRKIDWKKEGF